MSDATAKAALKGALHMPMLTFPAIFVRGAFLGGLEQLRDAVESGALATYLSAERVPFPGLGLLADDPVKLTAGPRGQPWYCFQLHVYANFVRAVSLLHVAAFAGCLGLVAADRFDVAFVIIAAVVVDLVFVVLLGPSPLAPLSTLVTCLVWRVRGNAVPSFPYKVIFGFYIVTFGIELFCGDGFKCADRKAFKATLGSLLLNSALLAVLRF